MKNTKISIKIFRISADSKYLEMVFRCDSEYYFTSLNLEVRYFEGKERYIQNYTLSDALFTDPEQKKFAIRIPIDKLGINFPAIYIGTFKVQKTLDQNSNSENSTEQDCNCINDSCLQDTAICSDANYAYRCMLDDLFMDKNACEDVIPDEVIRKYLLLYGHQAALYTGDLETAETYFKLIENCFNKCSQPGRGSGSCCSKRVSASKDKSINLCNCG